MKTYNLGKEERNETQGFALRSLSASSIGSFTATGKCGNPPKSSYNWVITVCSPEVINYFIKKY